MLVSISSWASILLFSLSTSLSLSISYFSSALLLSIFQHILSSPFSSFSQSWVFSPLSSPLLSPASLSPASPFSNSEFCLCYQVLPSSPLSSSPGSFSLRKFSFLYSDLVSLSALAASLSKFSPRPVYSLSSFLRVHQVLSSRSPSPSFYPFSSLPLSLFSSLSKSSPRSFLTGLSFSLSSSPRIVFSHHPRSRSGSLFLSLSSLSFQVRHISLSTPRTLSYLLPRGSTSFALLLFSSSTLSLSANPSSSRGDLLKLLDVSVDKNVLPTTYGKLQPPLGTHRLKIVEFISVITTVGSEAAEKALIRLGVLRRILELFFEYPYNNFLHHRVEEIIVCCLESKNASLVKHILEDCNLVRSIIDAERNSVLSTDENNAKPTVPTEGRMPPRIGNVGHMTRIANKLVQLMADNDYIYAYLQDNSEWVEWHTNVLLIRNTLGNVSDWECGWSVVPTIDVNGSSLIPDSLKRKLKLTWRPAVYHDQGRNSDDDDYQDRDYDVSALANNLSQAFRYGISENDDNIEASGSLERDDEDAYFDDESAEAFISSLHLGDDDQESGSVFENLQWFPYEDENEGSDEEENEGGGDEIPDVAECVVPDSEPSSTDTTGNNSADDSKPNVTDNPFESAEQGDSTQPSDTITESAGPSQSVTDDLPDSQNEPNEASSPCCTTKGDSDVTSSSPDPQRESELDTMTSQTQEESETHTDWTESGL
ncbi:serine/threonine-protein phosphatase 6 regulatory subunit 3-like protein [Tanacetum coccineum]